MTSHHHINQRLSLKSQLCTIRRIGKVPGKTGEWLGVEWDDPTRGKHGGSYGTTSYFSCRSDSPTCASFIRPNQPWDEPRTFLEALREKYVSNTDASDEVIFFASKQAEEVGFEKFARRQAQLQGIHVLVLDRMRIRFRPGDQDNVAIKRTCAEITDLDVGGNLFETIEEVAELCRHLPKLRKLVLDANHIVIDDTFLANDPVEAFTRVQELSLSRTLLDWENEVDPLLRQHFTSLRTLMVNNNECAHIAPFVALPSTLRTLELSDNNFESIENLAGLANNDIEVLILKNNKISEIGEPLPFPSVRELDIRHNKISSFTFIDTFPAVFPNLRHLRTTGNPLYANLTSSEGQPLAFEDGYMLTIARLPRLETLNYSKITEKERLNAETYYLNTIATEISKAGSNEEAEKLQQRHPRWKGLCDEYGEPAILRKPPSSVPSPGTVEPHSLAARMVMVTFTSNWISWKQELPKSFSVYEVMGSVGRKLNIMPLKLRLLYETGEQDPLALGRGYEGPEWWCSDSETDDELGLQGRKDEWALREVELIPGTRTLGTYVEGREASIRVEMR
ncbi:hypothetical protein LTR62_000424 [Meristemomyces frigidus]|uniref:CAP-Gly domain-containing protein n=1 Tax=Meristemomyces frigidus TaxID=1508187 RepID=A0AAN7YM38_9PEZI|nr:hypothetical protein LTR62_000424 [Meristemomyces frigidus]